MRFSELKNKELVCSTNGLKVGFVDDVELDPITYQITHLIAYGKGRFFGLFGKYEDLRIASNNIQVIGDDIILIANYEPAHPKTMRQSPSWFHLFD